MSIWCSVDHGEEIVPVDRDNYSGEPETDGGTYFVDVATSHLYHGGAR